MIRRRRREEHEAKERERANAELRRRLAPLNPLWRDTQAARYRLAYIEAALRVMERRHR